MALCNIALSTGGFCVYSSVFWISLEWSISFHLVYWSCNIVTGGEGQVEYLPPSPSEKREKQFRWEVRKVDGLTHAFTIAKLPCVKRTSSTWFNSCAYDWKAPVRKTYVKIRSLESCLYSIVINELEKESSNWKKNDIVTRWVKSPRYRCK